MTLIHRGGGSSCRGRIFGAVALVLVLLATGCTASSGDGSPTGVAESSTTASPAPAPTTAAVPAVYVPASAQGPAQNVPVPVLPEKAKEFSKEGLIAFAEYWFSTLGYVFETGDSGPMMAITDAGCKTCAFVNEPLAKRYEDDGWVVGGQMEVLQATSKFLPLTEDVYQAQVEAIQIKVVYYNPDGTVSTEFPQTKARTNIVNAQFIDNRWIALTSEPLKQAS